MTLGAAVAEGLRVQSEDLTGAEAGTPRTPGIPRVTMDVSVLKLMVHDLDDLEPCDFGHEMSGKWYICG